MAATKLPNRTKIVRDILDQIPCSAARIVKGELVIYHSFFWRPKATPSEWADRLRDRVEAAGFPLTYRGYIDNDYIPFKGGAPVWRQNHYAARFTFSPL